jgi:hypothetical protein
MIPQWYTFPACGIQKYILMYCPYPNKPAAQGTQFLHKTSGIWQRLVTRIIQKLWILPGALQFSPVIQSPKRYEAPWRGLQSVLVHSSPAIHLQLLVHSIATTPQHPTNSSQKCGNIAILSSFSYKVAIVCHRISISESTFKESLSFEHFEAFNSVNGCWTVTQLLQFKSCLKIQYSQEMHI